MSQDDLRRDPHPAVNLDDVVHHRARLGILTILSEVKTATFGYLKNVLKLTDGNLGRHLEKLAAQDMVCIAKGYEGRKPRMWVTITDSGEAALTAEMIALKQLLGRFEQNLKHRTSSPPPSADRNAGAGQ